MNSEYIYPGLITAVKTHIEFSTIEKNEPSLFESEDLKNTSFKENYKDFIKQTLLINIDFKFPEENNRFFIKDVAKNKQIAFSNRDNRNGELRGEKLREALTSLKNDKPNLSLEEALNKIIDIPFSKSNTATYFFKPLTHENEEVEKNLPLYKKIGDYLHFALTQDPQISQERLLKITQNLYNKMPNIDQYNNQLMGSQLYQFTEKQLIALFDYLEKTQETLKELHQEHLSELPEDIFQLANNLSQIAEYTSEPLPESLQLKVEAIQERDKLYKKENTRWGMVAAFTAAGIALVIALSFPPLLAVILPLTIAGGFYAQFKKDDDLANSIATLNETPHSDRADRESSSNTDSYTHEITKTSKNITTEIKSPPAGNQSPQEEETSSPKKVRFKGVDSEPSNNSPKR